MSADYPIADDNRFISEASAQLLGDRSPVGWLLSKQDGSMDFGYDYSIHVSVDHEVRHTIRAQLKGTTKPIISADGRTISIGLKRSTLNLFSTSQDEVLLLVGTLVFQENKKIDLAASKIYWQWVAPELFRIRGSRYQADLSEQQTFVLHVPTSNELTSDLDIAPYLDQRHGEAKAAEEVQGIAIARGIIPPGATDPMQQFVRVFRTKPSVLLGVGIDETNLKREGELGESLVRVQTLLRAGLTDSAEEALRDLDLVQIEQRPRLQASLLSLQGKTAVQRRQRPDALRLFELAYDLNPEESHLLSREELRFLIAIDSGDSPTIAKVAQSLGAVTTDEGFSLLARVLVALRRFDEASAAVDRIASTARTMPKLIVLSGQGRWSDVRDEASKALEALNLSRVEAMSIRLVAARACWSLALSTTDLSPDDREMPLTGAAGLGVEAAQAAWQFAKRCLEDLKKLGWQPNTELIAPIALASAAATGHHAEAMSLMREAAAARPEYRELQENLELLAIAAGDVKVAIEANLRQLGTHAVVVRRAAHLFQAKDYLGSLNAALQCLSTLDQAVSQTPMALVMGSAAASKLGRPLDADRLVQAVRSNESWGEFEYFARFVLANEARGSASAIRLQSLRDGLERFPNSRLLAANLLSNLNATTPEIAAEVVELGRRLRSDAELAQDDMFRLIDALFKLERWDEAEVETRLCIDRFGETEMSLSLLAVAAEMQGKTGTAIAALEKAMAFADRHTSTLRNYLNLNLRLGRSAAAQQAIEQLLTVEKAHDARLELLRLNTLCLMQLKRGEDAYAVLTVVGAVVQQDVEEEEGMYLNLYMAVTMEMPRLLEAEIEVFGHRSSQFSAKWPESRIFRVMRIPDDVTTTGVEESLQISLGGDPQERIREFNSRERKVREGLLSVPFVGRPSFVFHYIGDVFTLWQVASASGADDRQYHLDIASVGYQDAPETVLRDIPLLDLPALLVLQSLGQLGLLMTLYPRIAISRVTVAYTSQNAFGAFASGVNADAVSLLSFINENVERIDQPATLRGISGAVTPRDLVDDWLELAKVGRYVVYSDDSTIRGWIQQEVSTARFMCSLDLLRLADARSLLQPVEVGKCLARLAAWNVGIAISPRHFLALADAALAEVVDQAVGERLQMLFEDDSFRTMARAIWLPTKPPVELINHVALLVAMTLNDQGHDVNSAAALWAFWLNRLRLTQQLIEIGWGLLYVSMTTALSYATPLAEERVVRCALAVAEAVLSNDELTAGAMDDVVRGMGSTVGAIGKKDAANGERLRGQIQAALGRRTHDGAIFESAYLAAIARR